MRKYGGSVNIPMVSHCSRKTLSASSRISGGIWSGSSVLWTERCLFSPTRTPSISKIFLGEIVFFTIFPQFCEKLENVFTISIQKQSPKALFYDVAISSRYFCIFSWGISFPIYSTSSLNSISSK
jgi:hypothetical protein